MYGNVLCVLHTCILFLITFLYFFLIAHQIYDNNYIILLLLLLFILRTLLKMSACDTSGLFGRPFIN